MDPLIIVGGSIGLLGVIGISAFPALKVAPFAYGCARVRAARAHLLRLDDLKSLATENFKDVIYNLEKKGFTELLEVIEADYEQELVQKTLRRSYVANLKKVMRYVPNDNKNFFKILLSKEDIKFIVAVLRSKSNPYFDRHLFQSLHIGSTHFSDDELEELNKMSLEDFMMRLKKTPYGETVLNHSEEVKKGDLSGVEEELTKEHFKKLKMSCKNDEVLKKYVRLKVDIYNIKRALTFYPKVFIDGGSISKDKLNALEGAKEIKDVTTVLDGTKYHDYLKDVKSVRQAVQNLYRVQNKFADTLAMMQPLGINQILGYYIHKTIELRNVQILSKLIAAQFEPEIIMESLI